MKMFLALSLALITLKTYAWTPDELPYLEEARVNRILAEEAKIESQKKCLAKKIANEMDANYVQGAAVDSFRELYFFEKLWSDKMASHKVTFYLQHNSGNDILNCSISTNNSEFDVIYNCLNDKKPYLFKNKLLNAERSYSFTISKGCL